MVNRNLPPEYEPAARYSGDPWRNLAAAILLPLVADMQAGNVPPAHMDEILEAGYFEALVAFALPQADPAEVRGIIRRRAIEARRTRMAASRPPAQCCCDSAALA
jgi:hypothetical protein